MKIMKTLIELTKDAYYFNQDEFKSLILDFFDNDEYVLNENTKVGVIGAKDPKNGELYIQFDIQTDGTRYHTQFYHNNYSATNNIAIDESEVDNWRVNLKTAFIIDYEGLSAK